MSSIIEFEHTQYSVEQNIKELLKEDEHGLLIFNPTNIKINLNIKNKKIQHLNEKNFKEMSLVNNDIVYLDYEKEKYSIETYIGLIHDFESYIIDQVHNGNIKTIIFIAYRQYSDIAFIDYLDKNISEVILFKNII